MASETFNPEEPFGIVLAGQRCITKPADSWKCGNSATYIYKISQENPVSYFAIYLRHYVEKGDVAAIEAVITEGAVMHNYHFIGVLGPEKRSCFFKVTPNPLATGMTIYIMVQPKHGMKPWSYDTGPFIQLN